MNDIGIKVWEILCEEYGIENVFSKSRWDDEGKFKNTFISEYYIKNKEGFKLTIETIFYRMDRMHLKQ